MFLVNDNKLKWRSKRQKGFILVINEHQYWQRSIKWKKQFLQIVLLKSFPVHLISCRSKWGAGAVAADEGWTACRAGRHASGHRGPHQVNAPASLYLPTSISILQRCMLCLMFIYLNMCCVLRLMHFLSFCLWKARSHPSAAPGRESHL